VGVDQQASALLQACYDMGRRKVGGEPPTPWHSRSAVNPIY